MSLHAIVLRLAAALPLIFGCSTASSQAFPSKPVRLIVAGSPGSSMDISARAITEPMSKAWGVPVVVEVRPGANSIVGADAVAKAAPDGYTVLYVFTTFVQAPHATAKMPWQIQASSSVRSSNRAGREKRRTVAR